MQNVIPKLKAEWQSIAPKIEFVFFRKVKNSKLTKNILVTQIMVGMVKKSHSLFRNTKPKCEMWVSANAELSTKAAFFSPIDFAKLEWTMPLKNNSSPIGLNSMLVMATMANITFLSVWVTVAGILYSFPMYWYQFWYELSYSICPTKYSAKLASSPQARPINSHLKFRGFVIPISLRPYLVKKTNGAIAEIVMISAMEEP